MLSERWFTVASKALGGEARRGQAEPHHWRLSGLPAVPAFLVLATLLFGIGVSACTPRAGTHGDPLVRDRVNSIVPGVHTRDDVAAILGSPSTNSPFDGEKWYYISSRTETFAFLPREEFDRQVVVIAFDESGRVRSVEKFGQERGQDVAIVRRETPTAGNDLNLVQEFLGNIGRFNKNEAEAGSR